MYSDFVDFVRELYQSEDFIPLHGPLFSGNEKQYVCDAIDTTFVSSVSEYVDQFERKLCEFTGAKHAVSVMNGTAAIHLALHALGVGASDEVITQPLTFVATCNAIVYTGAQPVFVDVDRDTMGLSPDQLDSFLQSNAEMKDDVAFNKITGKRIAACLPMHTFGHPVRIREIVRICDHWNIPVIEDAAESIGSTYQNQHCGTFTTLGVMSFNGNKIITTGGGGALLTDNEALAKKLKFLSTTAKTPHAWKYRHDELGFNYRMPGLNAALGCAQMEQLPNKIKDKRLIAQAYAEFTASKSYDFVCELDECHANYWLNTLILKDETEREAFLQYTNQQGVMTRPAWDPMHFHERFSNSTDIAFPVAEELYRRAVNIPSSSRV
ncbi:MAG: LegC family aminotransferase [Gammaproteobacteria bacterium]|nr:LegC family aminotransferase [Gammaproteobacteria bacterium]